MLIARLLAPAALRDAAAAVDRGWYVQGARVDRRWLRLAAFLTLSAVLLLGFSLLASVIMTASAQLGVTLLDPALLEPSAADLPLADEMRLVAALAVILSLMALAVLAACAIAYRRRAADLLWPDRRDRLRLFGLGVLVMGAAGFLLWPVSAWTEPGHVAPLLDPASPIRDRALYALVAAVGLLFAAAAEEVVFRGVLLHVTATFTRNAVILCLINGVLFSLVHLDPDPVAFAARAMSGAVWTWAALRLGGVAFAVGAHWANNLFIALMLEPISAAAEVGQDISPVWLLPEALSLLLVFTTVELIARARR